MPEFSIVIPTFNRADITKSCVFLLLKLLEKTEIGYEIIVVNDGSTDDTEVFFHQLANENKNIRLIRTDKTAGEYRNPGFARNAGIQAAKGKYICFSDGDIMHLLDPLAETKRIMDANNGECYITGVHYRYMNGELQGPRGVGVDMPHGSWLAVSRDKLISIGGYDQRFKRYGNEDHDIVQRLRRLGLKHISSAKVVAFHPEFDSGRSTTDLDSITKELQMEVQRDPSVVRNKGLKWGVFTEMERNAPLNEAGKNRSLEEINISAIKNNIDSIADNLSILASNNKKIDAIFNISRSLHSGYVSLENPIFQRKKHSSAEKEIFSLFDFGPEHKIASDLQDFLRKNQYAHPWDTVKKSSSEFDFVIVSEVHRQRNLGLYLDAAFNALKEDGVCIVICPAFTNSIGSGNANSLWNAGYILYNLIMAGFDCKKSKVSTFENEIQLSAYKTGRRAKTFSIADCFDYFPVDVYQHFNGNIKEVNWVKDSK